MYERARHGTVRLTRPQNITASLYAQWKINGLGSNQQLLSIYGNLHSWTIGYNLFADKWLGTEVVEASVCMYISSFSPLIILQVYDGHSSFLLNNIANVNTSLSFVLPIESYGPEIVTTVSS